MKKSILIGVLMLVILVGVVMSGCKKKYDFANDSITVVLENAISIEFVRESFVVTPAYFPELKLSEVKHVGTDAEENVRKQLNGEPVTNPINVSTFKISLDLILSKPNHKTVLKYKKILEARDDVYGASVNGFGTII